LLIGLIIAKALFGYEVKNEFSTRESLITTQ